MIIVKSLKSFSEHCRSHVRRQSWLLSISIRINSINIVYSQLLYIIIYIVLNSLIFVIILFKSFLPYVISDLKFNSSSKLFYFSIINCCFSTILCSFWTVSDSSRISGFFLFNIRFVIICYYTFLLASYITKLQKLYFVYQQIYILYRFMNCYGTSDMLYRFLYLIF